VIRDEDLHDLVKKYFPQADDPEGVFAALREDFGIYAREKARANHNQVHHEIEKLHRAAERCYEKEKQNIDAERRHAVATVRLLNSTSAETRRLLEFRATQRGEAFPLSEESDFCGRIAALCRIGGELKVGRKRKSLDGREWNSNTWKPALYAPPKDRKFQRRESEHDFVIHLQLTWLHATGAVPATTADLRKRGPFARFCQECLDLAGSPHVNAVKVINSVARDRREMSTRNKSPVI
jgi:hypothetical protein